jgi:hypothetical protein
MVWVNGTRMRGGLLASLTVGALAVSTVAQVDSAQAFGRATCQTAASPHEPSRGTGLLRHKPVAPDKAAVPGKAERVDAAPTGRSRWHRPAFLRRDRTVARAAHRAFVPTVDRLATVRSVVEGRRGSSGALVVPVNDFVQGRERPYYFVVPAGTGRVRVLPSDREASRPMDWDTLAHEFPDLNTADNKVTTNSGRVMKHLRTSLGQRMTLDTFAHVFAVYTPWLGRFKIDAEQNEGWRYQVRRYRNSARLVDLKTRKHVIIHELGSAGSWQAAFIKMRVDPVPGSQGERMRYMGRGPTSRTRSKIISFFLGHRRPVAPAPATR